MLILTIAMLVFPYSLAAHSVVAATLAEAALLGGTIVSINQEALSLTILFPTGESRALPVRDARLLHGLSVGDHVTFELNDEHTLIKIAKLPTDPAN
ncbi:MAG: hypothetical protein ABS70_00960 [Nitrospira sp. SCN 59-13]|nr:MAG: hypothetical protein ABS70_00960 [Nitrospira sp. SCN 59-13]